MRIGGLMVALVIAGCGSSGADQLSDELAASRKAVEELRAHVHALDLEVSRIANIDECAAATHSAADAGSTAATTYFIETDPPGAIVTAGGINYGRTPVTLHLREPVVEILVELPGYKPRHETLSAQRPSALYILRKQ